VWPAYFRHLERERERERQKQALKARR
jgi:hypothetical protein